SLGRAVKRILIAEDDVRLCDVIGEFLGGEGYGIVVAHDGQAALGRLRDGPIDLLIADINMPGLGGASLVHLLRTEPEWEEFVRLPIIVLSALWDVVTFDLDIQAGFGKPVKYEELSAKVRELIGSP
ncbi:MAG: response regulator, partial [Gemmatimonadales bacterium]